MSKIVIDASAILALVNDEKGADVVEKQLSNCLVSTINISEAACVLVKNGMDIGDAAELLTSLFADTEEFTLKQAYFSAGIFKELSRHGLSLGDRACVSLAVLNKLPLLTADKIWAKLKMPVDVELIR